MSPYPNTPTLEQLPLINIASTTWQRDTHKRKKQVESTFARIRQLHDELNAQLYAHPAERPQINSPADAFQIMDYFIGMLDHEEIWVMDLDTRNRVMSLIKVTQGLGELLNSQSLRDLPPGSPGECSRDHIGT